CPLPVRGPMGDPCGVPITPPCLIAGNIAFVAVRIGYLARRQRDQHIGLVLDQQPRDRLGPLRAADDKRVALRLNRKPGFQRLAKQGQPVHVTSSSPPGSAGSAVPDKQGIFASLPSWLALLQGVV